MKNERSENVVNELFTILSNNFTFCLISVEYFELVPGKILNYLFNLDNNKLFNTELIQQIQAELQHQLKFLDINNFIEVKNKFSKNVILINFLHKQLKNDYQNLASQIYENYVDCRSKIDFLINLFAVNPDLFFNFSDNVSKLHLKNQKEILQNHLTSSIHLFSKQNIDKNSILQHFESTYQNYLTHHKSSDCHRFISSLQSLAQSLKVDPSLSAVFENKNYWKSHSNIKIDFDSWNFNFKNFNANQRMTEYYIKSIDQFLYKLLEAELKEPLNFYYKKMTNEIPSNIILSTTINQIVENVKPMKTGINEFLKNIDAIKSFSIIIKLANLQSFQKIFDSIFVFKSIENKDFKNMIKKTQIAKIFNQIYEIILKERINLVECFVLDFFDLMPRLLTNFPAFYHSKKMNNSSEKLINLKKKLNEIQDKLLYKFQRKMLMIQNFSNVEHMRTLIEFMLPDDKNSLLDFQSQIDMNQPITSFEFPTEPKQIISLFDFKPLLKYSFFTKIFNLFLIFNPKIREKNQIIEDMQELALLTEYLNNIKEFTRPKSASNKPNLVIPLRNDFEEMDYNVEEHLNLRKQRMQIHKRVSLKELLKIFRRSFNFCCLIKYKFFKKSNSSGQSQHKFLKSKNSFLQITTRFPDFSATLELHFLRLRQALDANRPNRRESVSLFCGDRTVSRAN